MVNKIPHLPAAVVEAVVNAPDAERARIGRDVALGAFVVGAGVVLVKEYRKSKTPTTVWTEEEQAATLE